MRCRTTFMIPTAICWSGGLRTSILIPLTDIPEKGLHGITIPALNDRIIIGPTKDPLVMREAFIDLLGQLDQPECRGLLLRLSRRWWD
jgi:hypothetical protein